MSHSERIHIEANFRNQRFGLVIQKCEELRQRDPSSFERVPWLLKHLGIALIRMKRYEDGIGEIVLSRPRAVRRP